MLVNTSGLGRNQCELIPNSKNPKRYIRSERSDRPENMKFWLQKYLYSRRLLKKFHRHRGSLGIYLDRIVLVFDTVKGLKVSSLEENYFPCSKNSQTLDLDSR